MATGRLGGHFGAGGVGQALKVWAGAAGELKAGGWGSGCVGQALGRCEGSGGGRVGQALKRG